MPVSKVKPLVIASGLAKDRKADELLYGEEGRVVASNIPKFKGLGSSPTPGSGVARAGNTEYTVSPDGDINAQIISAAQPSTVLSPRAPMRRIVETPAGTKIQLDPQGRVSARQKVGNMDVIFDNDTPNDARVRFMSDPVDPIAQDIQYRKRVAAEQDRIASQPIVRANTSTSDVKLIQKGDYPGMGWKQRTALNQRILENIQADRNNTAALDREVLSERGNMTRTQIEADINREKNKIDREQLQSTQALRNAQISEIEANKATAQAELEKQTQLNNLQTQYINAKTVGQKMAIARQLKDLGVVKNSGQPLSVIQGKQATRIDPSTGQIVTTQEPAMVVDPTTATGTPVQVARQITPTQLEKMKARLKEKEGTPEYDIYLEEYNRLTGGN